MSIPKLLAAVGVSVTFFASAPAASAADAEVKVAPQRQVAPIPPGAKLRPVRIERIHARPTNEVVGEWQRGVFCSKVSPIRFGSGAAAQLFADLPTMARSEFDAAGHPTPSSSAFRTETQAGNNEYEMAATVVDMQVVLCEKDNDLVTGRVWLRVSWELFSAIERKVIYQVQSEGSYAATSADKLDRQGLVRRAVQSATRNLLADQKFVAELAREPSMAASDSQLSVLRVARRSPGGATMAASLPALRSAVVTLITGGGSGSGFYIHAEGYLLTNSHVVGDSKFLKVRLPSGREILGEVLRTDRRRDVALVKTEAVALAPVPLSALEPEVGAELVALGSPFGEKFESSMTKGILSGVRELDDQRWLQSDVTVAPGSSGGPLVDIRGAAVGMTTLGRAGINLFVPIKDALVALRLEYAD